MEKNVIFSIFERHFSTRKVETEQNHALFVCFCVQRDALFSTFFHLTVCGVQLEDNTIPDVKIRRDEDDQGGAKADDRGAHGR